MIAIATAVAVAAINMSAHTWHHVYTRIWYNHAMCIHKHESYKYKDIRDWHITTTWNGYPSEQHGGMQIDVGEWNSIIQKYHLDKRFRIYETDPANATPEQQLIVSWFIWIDNGYRFGGNQWPNTSVICHVN